MKLAILTLTLFLSLNIRAEECDKKNPSKLEPIPQDVIEVNCGNPAIWFQYQYNGRSVKNCEEYLRLREAQKNIEGDPNLFLGRKP